MGFNPDGRSSTVAAIMKHQILAGRRFFGGFTGLPEEPAAEALLPQELTPAAFCRRNEELCRPRLARLATRGEAWWLEVVPFFDVQPQRISIFWRRVLPTPHPRTQPSVYFRLLANPFPPHYL